jgi:signal transduction histidine kinase
LDTKWKNLKELLTNKTAQNVYFTLSLLLFVGNLWLGPGNGKCFPALVILNFIFALLWVITGIQAAIHSRMSKVENAGDEEFHKAYYKIMIAELAGCLIYSIGVTAVLNFGRLGGNEDSFLTTLLMYHMGWIVFLIYLVPVFGSLLTVYIESDRYRGKRLLQKEHEAVLEIGKTQNFRTELLTNVTHDLKTPLTAIIGYLALMEKEELSPVMRDYVKAVSEKSLLLKEMIDKVFEISKASSGNAELELVSLDMNKLVTQVQDDVSDTYSDKKIPFQTELSQEKTDFTGDSMCVYRIVQNLLVNAVKYSLEGTRIFVKTYTKNAKVFLQVINVSNYPIEGNANDFKEKFVRGDKSRSTEGNGLGLAIVDAYVQALGGSFTIEIMGDTFQATVSFPMSATH